MTHPVRTCIACGRKNTKGRLLRLVLLNGNPVWDDMQTIPGRGAYSCAKRPCIERVKNNARRCLDRAFRKRVEP